MSTPRVLVDATSVPADRGGVGRYVDGLLGALGRRDQLGQQVVVLHRPLPPGPEPFESRVASEEPRVVVNILRRRHGKSIYQTQNGRSNYLQAAEPERLRGDDLIPGDVVAVHRLVQAVVRDRLDEGARAFWMTTAERILQAAFPDNPDKNVQTWSTCARLLPHAMAVVEHAGSL